MKKVQLLLVRHTETEAGARLRCVGRTDVDLSSAGRAALQERAERIAAFEPEKLLSSPLKRCQRLALAAAEPCGLQVETDVRWQEFDFGQWDGRTWVELGLIPAARHWLDHFWEQAPPGGDEPAQFMERIRAVLQEIAAGEAGRIAAVTHGGVIRAALCLRDGRDMRGAFEYEVPFGAAVEMTLPL